MTEDDVARRAARDVARLLDRRGLRELVALARRVEMAQLLEVARRVATEDPAAPGHPLPGAGGSARWQWLYPPTA